MPAVDVNALFLGPKSENQPFFQDMLRFLMEDHLQWRVWFQPDDPPAFTEEDQAQEGFQATLQRTREALVDLAGQLQVHSVPWFSPRYLGHMNADTLMAANLGYMLTLLYNPNNCAYEGSPATTALEIEVGRQLAAMLGYDPEKAWGHITSGGTVANYEAMWVARNLKSLPLALKQVRPDLVEGLNDWQLLNLPVSKILDLLDEVRRSGHLEALRAESVRGRGFPPGGLGCLLVPQSRHYSWSKAADILGIGQQNLILIRVKDHFRMDLDHLREVLDDLASRQIPVLAVVGVVGTTEEGAVDEIHQLVQLRDELENRGQSFYLHVDAAYGGYARAIFLDEQGSFMSREELQGRLRERKIFSEGTDWPDPSVHAAFEAMGEADSITIDPHKMGYVPYAAGAIAMKDRRVLDLISYFAAYVFDRTEDNPMLLGSYIMEGSKAGATAAAVWMAHQVVPLNVTGYGQLIGSAVEGASRFYHALLKAESMQVRGRSFRVVPLVKPDFNMVDFAFFPEGCTDLDIINDLNQRIYERCSYKSGPVYSGDFITSKTSLSQEEYGNAPCSFVARMGLDRSEWERVKSVYVLRSCILTPCLARDASFDLYWSRFMEKMWKILDEVVD